MSWIEILALIGSSMVLLWVVYLFGYAMGYDQGFQDMLDIYNKDYE